MAGNSTPQFTKNGIVQSVLVTAALADSSGAGNLTTPTIFKIATADATNGSWIDFVRVAAVATAATTTTATVGRIFVSSVTSGATTSANTFLVAEIALPATAADNASTAVNFIDVPLNIRLPAGYTLLASNHAAPAANTNWRFTAFGGDF